MRIQLEAKLENTQEQLGRLDLEHRAEVDRLREHSMKLTRNLSEAEQNAEVSENRLAAEQQELRLENARREREVEDARVKMLQAGEKAREYERQV